jgi:hypothetical protein
MEHLIGQVVGVELTSSLEPTIKVVVSQSVRS